MHGEKKHQVMYMVLLPPGLPTVDSTCVSGKVEGVNLLVRSRPDPFFDMVLGCPRTNRSGICMVQSRGSVLFASSEVQQKKTICLPTTPIRAPLLAGSFVGLCGGQVGCLNGVTLGDLELKKKSVMRRYYE